VLISAMAQMIFTDIVMLAQMEASMGPHPLSV
jgi:hypothetical protein